MARSAMIRKETKRSRLATKYAPRRVELRKKIGLAGSFEAQLSISAQMQALPRDSSHTRGVKRCRACGRSKGVYRKVGLCRIHFREAVMQGFVPGARKASW